VRHRGLGWSGRLEKLDGARAVVTVAGKRVRCAAAELVVLAGAGLGAGPADPPRSRPLEQETEVQAELILIGHTVEEGLAAVDDYLDRALRAAREEVRIVHGHGTGRLREAVRAHLRGHPAVADFRPGNPGEGGNGATVATLRE